jgi:hypothetical protein
VLDTKLIRSYDNKNSYHETERIILINDADSPVSSIELMYHAGDRKSGL